MWYANGLWPIACLLLASGSVAAQTIFHNDGNVVTLSSGAVVYVEGGVNNHNDGRLNNGGTFHFSDDWSSDTPVSDDVAVADGTFVFTGAAQLVRGNGTVAFPRVVLGAAAQVVRQDRSDVDVRLSIDLADGQWATGVNTLTILNVDPAAIDRASGFVSSDTIGGYLVRHTDRVANYLFPTGSTGAALRNPIPRYRPVIVTPVAAATDVFAVRFGNIDPSNDDTDGNGGFDRAQRDPTLTKINDEFYHLVDHPTGTTPADIKFYYDRNDGRFSTVAQVQDDDVWRDTYGSVGENVLVPFGTAGLDRVATIQNHTDFTQPVFTEAGADTDDDGVADRLDLDADNDGIANIEEAPSDPYGDHDGDGFFDYLDPDFPGCGTVDPTSNVCSNFDFDLDGYANHLDLDSDGDGIFDILEAGGTDLDLDAQVEYPLAGVANSMVDLDRDGFADARDYLDGNRAPSGQPEIVSGTPWPREDRDADGLPNDQDIDADGDGIIDFVEGQTTLLYFYPNGFDGNENGIDNAFDIQENGSYAVVPTNTDGADQPDYLDLNSDNERTSDLAEGHDRTGDGLIADADLPLGTDADGDGLDDRFDVNVRAAAPALNATNNLAFAEQFPNFEIPGTTELDWRELSCKQQDCQPLRTTRNQRP